MITITLEDALKVLNEAVEADRDAMTALCNARVTLTNEKLLDHPTIQVGWHQEQWKVGLLGILNGIFGAQPNGWGYIAADFDVVCPNLHETAEGATVQDLCPVCQAQYVLGKIVNFRRLSEDE